MATRRDQGHHQDCSSDERSQNPIFEHILSCKLCKLKNSDYSEGLHNYQNPSSPIVADSVQTPTAAVKDFTPLSGMIGIDCQKPPNHDILPSLCG